MVIRFYRVPAGRHYVYAAALAVLVPMALGYLVFWANPSRCYDSPCALPLLLWTVPPFAAPMFAVGFAANRRCKKPLPDGWLPTLSVAGLAGQAAISAVGVLSAGPIMRRIFLSDIVLVPQGLIVGSLIGAVFWAALYALARSRAQV